MRSRNEDFLRPRARVTQDELAMMPATLTAEEAIPWTRISRPAFYRAVKAGVIPSCRLGRAIRIPTKNFLACLGLLDDNGLGS